MAWTKWPVALIGSMALVAGGACDEILEPTPVPAAFDGGPDVYGPAQPIDAHVEEHDDAHSADAHGDASDHHACERIGLTGTAPNCLLFAECGHGEFAIDCIDGGGSCRCGTPDGGTAIVPYDPRFCDTGDGAAPAETLANGVAAAHAACGWN